MLLASLGGLLLLVTAATLLSQSVLVSLLSLGGLLLLVATDSLAESFLLPLAHLAPSSRSAVGAGVTEAVESSYVIRVLCGSLRGSRNSRWSSCHRSSCHRR